MKVNIIGGSGFIGTRLTRRLLECSPAVECAIFDKSPSCDFPELFKSCDVRSLDQLQSVLEPGAVVVNLAAEHRDDVRPRSLYDQVNVDGARNVCKAAEMQGISRIVFTSTVAVYGFAPPGTNEDGAIVPFNDYGRTKAEAEAVYREWQAADPLMRSLVIVRPTVVFGERNRGNVYNLLRQIASGMFVMIGAGRNRKSMAYVGNVAAFLQHMLHASPGVHVCNYVDKPDFDMNDLVALSRQTLGKSGSWLPRIPYAAGYAAGWLFDLLALVTRRTFPISRIRVRKFCATTQFASAVGKFDFSPPYTLQEGLQRTIKSEFLEDNENRPLFYSE
jgi:nucleoside-diphosphate-sugar epimerase